MLKTDKIADFHIHIGGNPDIDNNLAMIKELKEYGIKDMNIAVITYLEYPLDDNIRALYYKEKCKDVNISVFGGLYFSSYINHFTTPYLEQAQKLLDMGCDGLKLITEKPNYRKFIGFGMNSKIYDDMFDMLEEKQVPLLCHINDPEEYWDKARLREWPIGERLIELGWSYDNPSFLTYEQILEETLERLERNPNLKITFAHFMFLSNNIELARTLLEKYPNLSFDLTPGWEMYVGFLKKYDEWRELFEKYSNRIYYGTDTSAYPINKNIHKTVQYAIGGEDKEISMPHVSFAKMRGFDLSEEAQKNICYNNYVSTIGTPKPVNKQLLIEETEKMHRYLKNTDGDKEIILRLERIYNDLTR